MRLWNIVCLLVGICLGALPGAFIAAAGGYQTGISLMLIGIPIGIIYTSSKILDLDGRLLNWLFPRVVLDHRGRLVFRAFLVGLAVGGIVSYIDYLALSTGKRTLVLAPREFSPSDIFNAAAATCVGFGVWTAAAMGIYASPVYRRSILFTVGFVGYLAGCIGFAASPAGKFDNVIRIVTFLTTISVAVALVLVGLFGIFSDPIADRTKPPTVVDDDDDDEINDDVDFLTALERCSKQ